MRWSKCSETMRREIKAWQMKQKPNSRKPNTWKKEEISIFAQKTVFSWGSWHFGNQERYFQYGKSARVRVQVDLLLRGKRDRFGAQGDQRTFRDRWNVLHSQWRISNGILWLLPLLLVLLQGWVYHYPLLSWVVRVDRGFNFIPKKVRM